MNTLNKAIPKYPLLFAHGLFGFRNLGPLIYFNNIIEPLKRNGIKAVATTVHPTDSIRNRSLDLYKQMNDVMKEYNTDHVHIIAHSLGGLDARSMISNLDTHKSVLSLTTLSTPHKGSYIAQWSIDNIIERFYIEKLLSTVGIPFRAVADLTPAFMEQEFNPNVPDLPHVKYTSYGAYKDSINNFFTPLYHFHKILLEKEGKNDGLVSLNSARHGESFKIISDCDHRDLINLGWSGFNAYPIYENICLDIIKLEQDLILNPKLSSPFILNKNNNNNNNSNNDINNSNNNNNNNKFKWD